MTRQKKTYKTKKNHYKTERESRRYYLGEPTKSVYLTQREGEIMLFLLLGQTVNTTAAAMKLSPRTIEFYLKNMRLRLDCHSRADLIEKIMVSNFLHNFAENNKQQAG